jgi:AAA domain
MNEPHQILASPKPAPKPANKDAVAAAVSALEASLGRDAAAPAELLADIAEKLRGVKSADAPRRRAKAVKDADVALEAAREALRTKGVAALEEVRTAVGLYRKAHELPVPAKPRKRFGFAAALEDRPPPRAVCRKLEWEVGRPPMLIGPPGAGKTFVVQAAALDLIAGRHLWGCPDFRVPGYMRVLHVDLDQGANKTLRRFRRLLRGHGVDALELSAARAQLAARFEVDPRDLGTFDVDEGEGLRLMSLQPEELARWRSAWIDAVRDYDVAFVDSLRRLAPFLDENDSRFSIVPDMIREVSEAAQCVIVLLHHASNKAPPRGGPGPKPAAGTRGSSAIDGAAGSQLVIEPEGQVYRVVQTRAGEAAKLAPFYFAFEDDEVPGPGGVRGIRVAYQTSEQATAPERSAKAARLRRLADACLVYIRKVNLGTANKQGYGPLRKQVVQNVEGNDKGLYAALDLLVDDGLVIATKDGRLERLWLAPASSDG